MDPRHSPAGNAIRQASGNTVHGLFLERARTRPEAIAIENQGRMISYATLAERARRLAAEFASRGLKPGDRVAILSPNRPEYIEAELAGNLAEAAPAGLPALVFGEDYEAALAAQVPAAPLSDLDPESGLLILYTSGTTGLPKGALISHRAEIARMVAFLADTPVRAGDAFIAWAPMFHMASSDQQLATLMSGGTVIVMDGPDPAGLVDVIGRHRVGWLVMMPGPISALIDALERRPPPAVNVAFVGAMADLVPRQEIIALSRLLNAPYVNSFGSTETGLPPATRSMIAPGDRDFTLSKEISTLCEVRLLGADGEDVAEGEVGEMAVRGPTLFSGYWAAEETNARAFAGGWFRMGDLFRRNPDGTVDFVDRAKYMIKSGGENIYPAEIERILLADPRIEEAAVIRQADRKWGEIPIAVVAARERLTLEDVRAICRPHLAGYKLPKGLRVIRFEDFPRSTSGKVQRHLLTAGLGDVQAD